jgi:hypothetical protein
VRATARHPDGGLAVFREVFPAAFSGGRGEGVSELFEVDGSVRRIAVGVVVLAGEFDEDGTLRALVVPQWDFEADAVDTSVTDVRAIAVFASTGEVASIRPYPE